MDYSKILSQRASSIKPSGIRKFFDIVSEMPDAISLGVGEPDFETPWEARLSAIKCIREGRTQYTANNGLKKLRVLIDKYYTERYNLSYDPLTEIMVTVGASEAIELSLRALINPGDEVLVPDPSYVSYAPCITLAGGEPIAVPCYNKDSFKVKRDNLIAKITPKTKAIILPYPNNPTGAIMTKEDLEAITDVIISNNLIVISDEIYSELTYGLRHYSIASLEGMRERTIVINGFSKSFAMTGWRLGYVMAPKEIVSVMYKVHQFTIMCASTISQHAGIAALEEGFKDEFKSVTYMRDQYDMRRRYLVRRLNDMGLACFVPQGAFYVFPDVSSTGLNGEDFAMALLNSQKVAVVPGSAFGESGASHIRISYAYSMKDIDAALDCIEKFIKTK